MSFKYRKQRRTLAHNVLEEYYDKMILASKDGTKLPYLLYSDAKSNGTLADDDPVLFWASGNILIDNKYIELKPGTSKVFKITDEGINAYRSSFLLVENRKDQLESIELYTKWIIPVGSFIISIIALIFSITKK